MSEHLEAGISERAADAGYMVVVEGFQLEVKHAGIDVGGSRHAFMIHPQDVAAFVGHDFQHGGECAGLILHGQFELAEASGLGQPRK